MRGGSGEPFLKMGADCRMLMMYWRLSTVVMGDLLLWDGADGVMACNPQFLLIQPFP